MPLLLMYCNNNFCFKRFMTGAKKEDHPMGKDKIEEGNSHKRKWKIVAICCFVFAVLTSISIILVPLLLSKEQVEPYFYVAMGEKETSYKCEAINYPKPIKDYKESDYITVDVMIANLYYGRNEDGSYYSLDEGNNELNRSIRNIDIGMLDYDKQLIKRHSIDANEYVKPITGITKKEGISKDDFMMIYSFNILALIDGDYDGKVYFEVNYIEEGEPFPSIYGTSFSLDFHKDESSITFSKLKTSYQTSAKGFPKGEIHYCDVIDVLSSNEFDYKNPEFSSVSLSPADSFNYYFKEGETYQMTSLFDKAALKISRPKTNDLPKIDRNTISIYVNYAYIKRKGYTAKITTYFSINKDGTIIFNDRRRVFSFYGSVESSVYTKIYDITKKKGTNTLPLN